MLDLSDPQQAAEHRQLARKGLELLEKIGQHRALTEQQQSLRQSFQQALADRSAID